MGSCEAQVVLLVAYVVLGWNQRSAEQEWYSTEGDGDGDVRERTVKFVKITVGFHATLNCLTVVYNLIPATSRTRPSLVSNKQF